VIGVTFFGGKWMPDNHLYVQEARQIYLIHLSTHFTRPVTNSEMTAYVRGLMAKSLEGIEVISLYELLCETGFVSLAR
jgi:hypothetical protein